jgi:N-acetylglucosaminyldiphosphoundecaprenol N-acetyl-beta-D-mannosaminyltransferase
MASWHQCRIVAAAIQADCLARPNDSFRPQGANILLGVRIGRAALDEIVARSMSAVIGTADRVLLACANPHSMVVAKTDAQFRNALNSATHVVSDGVGCRIAARLTGRDLGPRITGFDYFEALMRKLNERGGKVFFLGSSTETLTRIKQRCAQEYSNLAIYAHSPPFGAWTDAQDAQILQFLRDAEPDILWVGLTAPKQEKWVAAHRDSLRTPVIGCIGAVFDYYAGTVKRAPRWLCRAGLEWLYRLAGEPRRLWKRTIVSFPVFMWLALHEHWSRPR